AEHTARGFAHHCEGFRQQLVQRLALRDARLECVGLATQLRVIELLKLRLECVDARDLSRQLAQHAVIAAAEYGRQGTVEHRRSGWLGIVGKAARAGYRLGQPTIIRGADAQAKEWRHTAAD